MEATRSRTGLLDRELRTWIERARSIYRVVFLSVGCEVYPVVAAIGGTSVEARRAGLERFTQAGGRPISWLSLACELQRD